MNRERVGWSVILVLWGIIIGLIITLPRWAVP
jgi:hypothetical protein